jgi:serine/threonine protein kinase
VQNAQLHSASAGHPARVFVAFKLVTRSTTRIGRVPAGSLKMRSCPEVLMDRVRAQRLAQELTDKTVGGWTVRRYLGNGKSAVVLEAERAGAVGALKLFDPDIVERYGEPQQLDRISLEVGLRDVSYPHLIQILDGGKCAETGYLYVVMALINAPNLAQCLHEVPRDKLRTVISQVAAAAELLESHGLSHRDIKPENIGLDVDRVHATLLDLGVLRHIAVGTSTDVGSMRPFIGTLQYSSPEFLLRAENDTSEGWRAVTFYQLGGVLHDLIMRKPLFHEYREPFIRLSDAVRFTTPQIVAEDVSRDLIQLARDCLVKNPDLRLGFVNWDRFRDAAPTRSRALSARDRFVHRQQVAAESQQPGESTSTPISPAEQRRICASTVEQVRTAVRQLCVAAQELPPLQTDVLAPDAGHSQTFVLRFSPSQHHGFNRHIAIFVRVAVLDVRESSVSITAAAALTATAGSNLKVDGWSDIFSGVLDLDSVKAAVEDVVYTCLDAAQSEVGTATDGASPEWIPLNEMRGES